MSAAVAPQSKQPAGSLAEYLLDSAPARLAASAARSAALGLLRSMRSGQLTLTDETGKRHHFGVQGAPMKAKMRVLRPAFWLRVALFDHLGFGEAYMYGDVQVDDLGVLLKIFAQNRDAFADFRLLPPTLARVFDHLSVLQYIVTVPANTIYKAITNVSAHYDLGNDMFQSFLDPTMTYSCPIWKTVDPADREEESLESASLRKLHTMISKARIGHADHVLEIGSGWGSMAIEAVKQTGCRVTTLTLSVEQKKLAEERIAAAGLSDRITVLLKDYRAFVSEHLAAGGRPFDRLLSCEMLEAVGFEFLPTYFDCVDRILDKKRGVACIQFISMPESRYEEYRRTTDYIQKHIFPGGHCPTPTAVIDAVYKGSKGNLIVEDLENIGGHYAKALRIWREEFVRNFDKVVAAADEKHKRIYDDVFRRKWEFYFAYCEAGFAAKILGDHHIVLCREADDSLLSGIPM
ncbi:Mycolic acid cyclopropane synthetase-domain-containing protein [Hyaloraphidium curvatum]|nr:Mycolic acid cyclopropane synthetase-domain-containing protein [Hyaloraphidium curvatum]